MKLARDCSSNHCLCTVYCAQKDICCIRIKKTLEVCGQFQKPIVAKDEKLNILSSRLAYYKNLELEVHVHICAVITYISTCDLNLYINPQKMLHFCSSVSATPTTLAKCSYMCAIKAA